MGSFLTRAFIMILGYAYPAYECYKTVERNKPEIEQLLFWCRYWILVALLTVFERFGDAFVSWLPMYSEAKLAFIVYLWYPKTKGTTYVYNTFFRPYLAKHETEIDRGLSELRTRAGDMAILYWQKALTYGQTRFFEILQYVALQSYSISRPAKQAPLASASHQSAGSPKQHLKPAPSSPTQILSDTTLTEAKATQGNVAGASVIQESNSPPPLETVTEAVRVRSGRLRNRAASSGKADAIQVNVVHTLGTQDSNPPPPPPPPEMGKKAGVPVRGGKLRNRVASNSGK